MQNITSNPFTVPSQAANRLSIASIRGTNFISALFIFSAVLLTGLCHASEHPFDSQYSIQITKTHSYVAPPSLLSDYWKANHFISLSNGLYAYYSTSWKHESQAKEMASFTYSGNVNLIYNVTKAEYGYNYFVLQREKYEYPFPVALRLERNYTFDSLPRIISIIENIEIIEGWFFDEKKYHYIIEMSDGTVWKTTESKFPWAKPWEIDSHIMLIGNGRDPCFINIDAVANKTESRTVEREHFFVGLTLMK